MENKPKPIADCPECGSNRTYIYEDVLYNGNVYFLRECWNCFTRFVEYNKIVNMSWLTPDEFDQIQEEMFDEHAKRRSNPASG